MKSLRILLYPSLASLIFLMLHCTKITDISGVYVHQKGLQRYYTLTVKPVTRGTMRLQFEGVPLDLMKNHPWSIQCDGRVRGKEFNCAKNKISIEESPLRLNVVYENGEKQVFINSIEGQEEEIFHFKER